MRSASAFLFAALLVAPALAQENPVADGIALWLRADAGVTLDASNRVASWQDQSNDAFVFTHVDGVADDQRPLFEQGVLNGQDVVRFDGNDFLTAGDVLDNVFASQGEQRFMLFVVIHPEATIGDATFLSKNSGPSFGENQNQTTYRLFDNRVDLLTHYTPHISSWRNATSDTSIEDSTLVLAIGYDGSQSGNNGLDRFYMLFNGEPEPISLQPGGKGTPLGRLQDVTAPLTIGARANVAGTQAAHYFEGDIAEIILYDRLLTDLEREQVETYLGAKYGINVTVAVEDGIGLPQEYRLSAIYPNPFNPQATFQLEVDQAQQFRVAVYDLLGREVVVLHEGNLPASDHTFTLRSDGLGSGIYFVRVVGERFTDMRRAVLLR